MQRLKLAGSLWLFMLGCLLGLGLVFKLALFNGLPSLVTTGFQELFLLMILIGLNLEWLHQPLHFHSPVAGAVQRRIALPVTLLLAVIGLLCLPLKPVTTTLLTLLVAGLISLFEEVLFRGIIFKLALDDLQPTKRGVLQAAAVSSGLFSLTHLINLAHQSLGITALQLVFTFAIGLLLCALYFQTGSLWWPLAVHALNDFFSFTQPTINLPLIHTTASFQFLEIVITLIFAWITWSQPLNTKFNGDV